MNKIRVALNKTGKFAIAMGFGEQRDDLLAKTPRRPDYTLSGEIIEDREQAGSTRQSSFIFQFSLTSAAGVLVWAEEKTITKQGRRAPIGL